MWGKFMYSLTTSKTPLRIAEDFLIELVDSSIWRAKGIYHPANGIIAFPKYVRGKKYYLNYGKLRNLYSARESYDMVYRSYKDFLKYINEYDMTLPIIPFNYIKRIYSPFKEAMKILMWPRDFYERKIRDLLMLLSSSLNINTCNIGVSGGFILGSREFEVIKILIAGVEGHARYVNEALSKLVEEGELRNLSQEEITTIYEHVGVDYGMALKAFRNIVRTKKTMVTYKGIPAVIKPLREFTHTDSQTILRGLGRVVVLARIVDARNGIMYPPEYGIEVLEVADGPRKTVLASKLIAEDELFMGFEEGAEILVRGRLEYEVSIEKGLERFQIRLHRPGHAMIPLRRK